MSEDELSEISLMNKIFKMLHKGITLNSVVPPAIMVGTILICSRMGWIMLGCLRGLHLGLFLDGAKDLVNRKLQWGEVSVHLENSELALRGVRVNPLVGVMPSAMSLSLVWSLNFILGGAACCIPYCLFQLYILLGSR